MYRLQQQFFVRCANLANYWHCNFYW